MVSLALLVTGAVTPAAAAAEETVPESAGSFAASVVTADDGSLTFTLDAGTVYDPVVMQKKLDQAEAENPLLSDTIRSHIEQYPVGIPGESGSRWADFDGTLSMTAGYTGLSLTIPASDVQTSETWLQWAFAMAMGWLAGSQTETACLGLFPEFVVACPAVAGFTGALVKGLLIQYFDHTLGDPEALTKTFLDALKGAMWGYARGSFGKWMEERYPGLIKAISDSLKTIAWSVARDAAHWVAEVLRDMADLLPDGIIEWGPPPTNATSVRLLPVGDSITYGVGSTDGNGYRKLLWDALDAQGLEPDFIGCNASGDMPDPEHEGNRGHLIAQMANPAVRDATSMRPNVVTLMAGTNDVYRQEQIAEAPGRLSSLIDQLQEASPDVAIAVATIVPVKNDTEAQKRRDAYNAQVRSLVQDRQDSGQKVMLAELGPMTESMLFDTLHPNDIGYTYIAQRFGEAVTAMVSKGWVVDTADGTANADACVMAGGGWQQLGRIAEGPINPDSSSAGIRGQVRLADFDGNGRTDYAVVTDTGAVYLWTKITGGWVNRGKVAAGNGVPGRGSQVRFADLDGDHDADYLVVDDNGAVRAWRNDDVWINGGSAWHYMGTVAEGTGTGGGSDIHFADLDGDLLDDYLVVHDDGSIDAWINDDVFVNGHSAWTGLGLIAGGVGYPGSKVRLADLDGDKDADYLIVHSDGSTEAWLNASVPEDLRKGWTSIGKIATGTGTGGDAVQFADTDADRDADYFVIDTAGTATAWENDEVATRSDKENGFKKIGLYGDHLADAAANARSVRFADLDGDADADYLLVGPKGEVEAWRNDGVATRGTNAWTKIGRVAEGVSPGETERVVFADYNGDGRDDYLVVDDTNGRVRGWRNDGPFTGGITAWTGLGVIAAGPATAPEHEVQFADIDGDGDDDYLLVAVDHSVTAWKNNGTDAPGGGGWAAQGLLARPQEATVTQKTVFARMNTDELADYVLRDPGENNALYGWMNLGAFTNQWTAKKKVAHGVVMGFPVEVTLADLSGDGLDDYLVVDPTNGATRAWVNLGGNLADP
ncbi:FG-GAP-like repeat-containing protein [Streptomyces sp. NPDC003247]|uniref:FG-GAP-like repeat-containing protein n=1 Tax=Streptomyces sp. NPDC003247 TaxID=3364677 RepID=UPI003682515E